MNDELYRSWKKEKTTSDLQTLKADFYKEALKYIKELAGKLQTKSDNPVESSLTKAQLDLSKRYLRELILERKRKISDAYCLDKLIPLESLTIEEKAICKNLSDIGEGLLDLTQTVNRPFEVESKISGKVVLRFLQKTPALVGVDMKTYGAFKAGDVASIPESSAHPLIDGKFATIVKFRQATASSGRSKSSASST